MDPSPHHRPRRPLLQARQLLPYDHDELARMIDAHVGEDEAVPADDEARHEPRP
jgi:hypothetical protein